ncbi:MAG: hypothetical protein JWN29_393, partial [Acidimicrobiales bacterium]|nr:hypothetical protein [Acidimicrobiales bacterium]
MARAAASARPPVTPAGPLRPLLRLRHLPDRALASVRKVLDEDELLRSVVAAATTEELVGRASWLYLQRPAGWETALEAEVGAQREADAVAEESRSAATASRRLASVEDALRRTEADAMALRVEVAELKGRLAEERRARRAADTDAGRLRRRLADLEAVPEGGDVREERDRLAERVRQLELAAPAAPPPPPAPAP